MAPKKTAKADSFERILEKLEAVVADLEGNELPLEKALERFEEGVRLSREGSKRLEDAERRIEEILEDGSAAPLDIEEGGGEERGDEDG